MPRNRPLSDECRHPPDPQVGPVLVLACGNPSRGDDALGPCLIERLEERQRAGDLPQVDLLGDFQLQIEHALDLRGRELVIFVDAAASGPEPFTCAPVRPERDTTYSTHGMTPGAVLRVHQQIFSGEPPPARLLAIRGYGFDLGSPVSEAAVSNLKRATTYLLNLLRDPRLGGFAPCGSGARARPGCCDGF